MADLYVTDLATTSGVLLRAAVLRDVKEWLRDNHDAFVFSRNEANAIRTRGQRASQVLRELST